MTRQASSTGIRTLLVALAAISGTASAATITVNSTADAVANDGFCTLREAINSANGNIASGAMAGECIAGNDSPTADTIAFSIPSGGVQTISPTAALPPLTHAVLIDGYTQGDASPNTLAVGTDAKLRIEIDGSALPSGAVLQYINTDDATIRGLVIDHLGVGSTFAWGFWINGHNGNTISGNYLQTDPTGNTFVGNTAGGESSVIVIGNSNLVGGTDPGDRNVIAGGHGYGSSPVTIAGTGNIVQGNYIGVSADGTSALQPDKQVYAIDLGFRGPLATDTLIGGPAPGAGNVIYGQVYALHIRGVGIDGTVIQGNLIGTDATGSYALGAGSIGILLIGATNTTIGGAGAGNVISGFSEGIQLYGGFDESGTLIQGNKIGTDSTGTHAIANTGAGIHIGSPSVNAGTNTQGAVGGVDPGEGNTIAYNCGAGISFDNNAAFRQWPILGNSIHSNHGLGIRLGFTGLPLLNDSGDGDTGPNDLQNYPVITSAPVSSGSVSISGTLNSTPNSSFRIEFFSGIGCHATGNGEGRNFLGAADAVTTNANGDASFDAVVFSVPPGHSVFTATATDPDGNTSEFSQCFGTPDLLFSNGFEGGCSGSD